MRTTVIIDNTLESKLRHLISKRGLSAFINQCLREHFEREEKKRFQVKLEASYARVAKQNSDTKDFETLDPEDWPE